MSTSQNIIPTGTQILPKTGLSQLSFGTSRGEIRERLGEPDEIDRQTDSDDFTSESWHYDEWGVSLVVEEVEDWRLTTIAVSEDVFSLGEIQVIGKTKEAALNSLKTLNLGPFEEENWTEEDDDESMVLLTFPEVWLNCWLSDGVVTEIQWGVPYNDEDEAIWPE